MELNSVYADISPLGNRGGCQEEPQFLSNPPRNNHGTKRIKKGV